MLLKLLVKLAPGWVLNRVNFDPIQENGQKGTCREWVLFRETMVHKLGHFSSFQVHCNCLVLAAQQVSCVAESQNNCHFLEQV